MCLCSLYARAGATARKLVITSGLALIVATTLAGCSATAGRIKRNPYLFATFPPEVQNNVRRGRIDIGYTKEMVSMALGWPQQIEEATGPGQDVEVWIYSTVTYAAPAPAPSSAWVADSPTSQGGPAGTGIPRNLARDQYESMRVEFRGNRVIGIESP